MLSQITSAHAIRAAPIYQPPGMLVRMARELPAYAAMQWANRACGPVPLNVDGKGHKLIVYPGLAASPDTMRRLITSLRAANFDVYDWGQGRNLGFQEGLLEKLIEQLTLLSQAGPVSLVGWSLGGLVAREVAKHSPEHVARVITMGSPFSGDVMHNNNAWRTYRLLSGHHAGDVPLAKQLAQKPPVPTYAIWSKKDGVISVGGACGKEGERDHSIEVDCRHMEFSVCPHTIRTVAKLLLD